jgi:hypothetical protein
MALKQLDWPRIPRIATEPLAYHQIFFFFCFVHIMISFFQRAFIAFVLCLASRPAEMVSAAVRCNRAWRSRTCALGVRSGPRRLGSVGVWVWGGGVWVGRVCGGVVVVVVWVCGPGRAWRSLARGMWHVGCVWGAARAMHAKC